MKFTLDAEGFTGEVFEMLDTDDLTWLEAGAVERVTGLSMGDIDDRDKGLRGRSDVILAYVWVSVRRARPATTYSQLQTLRMGAVRTVDEPADQPAADQAEPAAPDPTGGAAGADPTGTPSDSTT